MFREGGRAESYMYYPNMKDFGTCGLSWMTSASFSAGNWHDVKLYVKLNTGGAPSPLTLTKLKGKALEGNRGIA